MRAIDRAGGICRYANAGAVAQSLRKEARCILRSQHGKSHCYQHKRNYKGAKRMCICHGFKYEVLVIF